MVDITNQCFSPKECGLLSIVAWVFEMPMDEMKWVLKIYILSVIQIFLLQTIETSVEQMNVLSQLSVQTDVLYFLVQHCRGGKLNDQSL